MGVGYKDVLRVFNGDNPASQFEAGHQRGGYYSCICFRKPLITLKDRFDQFRRELRYGAKC